MLFGALLLNSVSGSVTYNLCNNGWVISYGQLFQNGPGISLLISLPFEKCFAIKRQILFSSSPWLRAGTVTCSNEQIWQKWHCTSLKLDLRSPWMLRSFSQNTATTVRTTPDLPVKWREMTRSITPVPPDERPKVWVRPWQTPQPQWASS